MCAFSKSFLGVELLLIGLKHKVHYYDEGKLGDIVIKDPFVLGHESAGVVAKVGDGVKRVKVGDEVAMEPGIPCRFCDRCKEGRSVNRW